MEADLFYKMARVEKEHWWFTGRREIILSVIHRYAKLPPQPKILDIGCGTGANLEALSKLGSVTGLDQDETAIRIATQKGVAPIAKGSIPDLLPFERETFDLITMLDVLEHIEDDEKALRAVLTLLKPLGYLVITVPAYSFLWSQHDVVHHHMRRYLLTNLSKKLQENKIQIKCVSYFNAWLFFPIAIVRVLTRWLKTEKQPDDLKLPPRAINKILDRLFASEKHFVGRVKLPFGVSIIACGQKTGQPEFAANPDARNRTR